jgi:hypothetical protein
MEVGYCNLSKTDFSKRELTPLDPSRKMRSEIPLFLACATANPLPESCVGLFITLCTGWILKKRTKKIVFAQTYQKSEKKEEKKRETKEKTEGKKR